MASRDEFIAPLLKDYMWAQRPPLNANKLALLLGIGRSTVSNWLKGHRPTEEMIALIAAKTAIPHEKLLHAAHYEVPGEVWDYIIGQLESNALMSPDVRAATIRHIHELRAKYEAEYREKPDGTLVLLPDVKPDAGRKPAAHRKAR